jgi:hypothetical protein
MDPGVRRDDGGLMVRSWFQAIGPLRLRPEFPGPHRQTNDIPAEAGIHRPLPNSESQHGSRRAPG